MSHDVRSHLCPEVNEKHFQQSQLGKKSQSHVLLCIRIDDKCVLLNLAFLASECSLTTIPKEV